MSKSKTERYVYDELNKIITQTREWQAYELGIASGYYQFYKYYKDECGEDTANKSFKTFISGTDKCNEYFRNLVKFDNEIDSEAEEIMNKLKECLDKKNR